MAKPPPPKEPDPVRFGTLIETEEDIRRAELADQQAVILAKPVVKAAPPRKTAPPARQPAAVPPFRPTVRPPICVLTVFDDGKTDGEVIRIRGDRFVIGRSEGDLLIPHDEQISSKHLEIGRQLVAGQRWVATDLQSTNGFFLRVSRAVLNDRTEFLVGTGRYRMELPGVRSAETVDHVDSTPIPTGTLAFGESAPASLFPALVEMVAGGIGSRIVLTKAEYWIGSDPACAIGRIQDPFAEPKHIHLFRDPNGVWTAQNNKSLNGLWLKVPQVTVDDSCLCQIGEQRFRLKVGG